MPHSIHTTDKHQRWLRAVAKVQVQVSMKTCSNSFDSLQSAGLTPIMVLQLGMNGHKSLNGASFHPGDQDGIGTSMQARLDSGAVLSDIQNICPAGTKAWMLCLGYLEGDEGYLVRGGNQSLGSTRGQPRPNKRRMLPMYCVLIEHPHEGLILWETGAGTVRILKLITSRYTIGLMLRIHFTHRTIQRRESNELYTSLVSVSLKAAC